MIIEIPVVYDTENSNPGGLTLSVNPHGHLFVAIRFNDSDREYHFNKQDLIDAVKLAHKHCGDES